MSKFFGFASTLGLVFVLNACGGGSQKVEGDGPKVEIIFLRMEDGNPVCLLKNRSESGISEIRGDFVFQDENGETIPGFMDRPADFPFQYIGNPIVKAGYQTEIELPVIVEEGAAAGYVEIDIVRFEDGSAFKP